MAGSRPSTPSHHGHFLQADELFDALARKRKQRSELIFAERDFFGSRLDLHNVAGARHHEVRVGVGFRILGIVEIEHGDALTYATGDGSDVVAQDVRLDHVTRFHPIETVGQRDPRSGDRCGPSAAVGLYHVAIERYLSLSECRQINHRTQATTDQTLNFHRAATLLACTRLAARALGGGAWQHAIFGRHPTAPLTLEPGR